MMHFSIGIEFECVRIFGSELELSLGRSVGFGHWTPLQKQETRRIGRGSSIVSFMRKSVLLY